MEANLHKNKVHQILAHSYLTYFILFLLGVCLDIFFQFKFFTGPLAVCIGFIFFILGTFLIIWAQKTTRNFKKDPATEIKKEIFHQGPYRYTRSPTHFGLFLLMLGFGVMVDAPFVILCTIISMVISKFFFLKKEEKILAEKYGVHYLEYKKAVKL